MKRKGKGMVDISIGSTYSTMSNPTNNEPIPPFVIKATIAASIGGILFGYDMGVISTALPQLTNTFNLTERQQEMLVSFLYIGCCIGATAGGFLCDRHGRKKMILITDCVFILGAIVLYSASTFDVVLFGRIVIGVAIAVSGIADVAYLHEISPKQFRGAVVSCNEAGKCSVFKRLERNTAARNHRINGKTYPATPNFSSYSYGVYAELFDGIWD